MGDAMTLSCTQLGGGTSDWADEARLTVETALAAAPYLMADPRLGDNHQALANAGDTGRTHAHREEYFALQVIGRLLLIAQPIWS